MPGGEISLINAAVKLDKLLKSLDADGNEETRVGINIVKKALEAPIRKLASNAGQDGSVIIDTVRRTAIEKKNKNIGYNVLTGKYVDMIDAGVIDPVKVVRGALENAASIAAMNMEKRSAMTVSGRCVFRTAKVWDGAGSVASARSGAIRMSGANGRKASAAPAMASSDG